MNKLLAPNGKPSNLNAKQYKLVRTPAFKKWFGDFENQYKSTLIKIVDGKLIYDGVDVGIFEITKKSDRVEIDRLYIDKEFQKKGIGKACIQYLFNNYEIDLVELYPHPYTQSFWLNNGVVNVRKDGFFEIDNQKYSVSKVVDENGEPMVCYHATDNKFWEFKKEKQTIGYYGKGFYFSNNLEHAKQYGKRVIPVFLNIKSVFELSDKTPQELLNKLAETNIDVSNLDIKDIEQRSKYTFGYESENSDIFINNLIKNGYYGIRMIYNLESSNYFYIVFEPNQIKLADGSNTNFDSNNPDIRFDNGGEVFNDLSEKSKEIIDANYDGRGSFGFYDFDYNKESERENYFEWLKDFKENQFKKNLSKVIKQVESDIKLKNEKEKSKIKLKYFEELIIPSLGNEVLIPKLSIYEKQVLLDPNATIESIQKGFKDAENIIDEDGSINQSKITQSNFIEDDEINLPAFEKFVEKNSQYKGVFNDWKKILDENMNLSLKKTYAFRYPSVDDLEYLHSELIQFKNKKIKDKFNRGGEVSNTNIIAQIWEWFGIKF